MSRTGILAAAVTLALAGAALAGDGKIPWVEDYETALARAKMTGRPLMVKFWATG